MHEANFTREIVEAILEKMKKHPERIASSVKVRVGDMLHLVPDSVKLHYDLLTEGTVLEGVELIFLEMPVRIKCLDCHREGGVEDHHLLMCSFCDSQKVKLLSGNEIIVDEIHWRSKTGGTLA